MKKNFKKKYLTPTIDIVSVDTESSMVMMSRGVDDPGNGDDEDGGDTGWGPASASKSASPIITTRPSSTSNPFGEGTPSY